MKESLRNRFWYISLGTITVPASRKRVETLWMGKTFSNTNWSLKPLVWSVKFGVQSDLALVTVARLGQVKPHCLKNQCVLQVWLMHVLVTKAARYWSLNHCWVVRRWSVQKSSPKPYTLWQCFRESFVPIEMYNIWTWWLVSKAASLWTLTARFFLEWQHMTTLNPQFSLITNGLLSNKEA